MDAESASGLQLAQARKAIPEVETHIHSKFGGKAYVVVHPTRQGWRKGGSGTYHDTLGGNLERARAPRSAGYAETREAAMAAFAKS
jgi:hypothetical protein